MSTQPPRRNDPCPCGSGRKYKRCCMGYEAEQEAREAQLAENREFAWRVGMVQELGLTTNPAEFLVENPR